MKRVLGMIPVALLSAGAFFSGTGLVYAADGDAVVIDESTFPDKVFRQYVLDEVDKNSDGELSQSEIDNCNGIFLSRDGYKNIENLKGLEYFTELERLGCEEQKLSSLDVSKNTKLTSLDCVSNNLSSLDISKNTKLSSLDCSSNNLSSLDISKNTTLTSLDCVSNNLSSLDISKNTKLSYLDCSSNNLSSLDISKNTKLSHLDCSSNDLSSLDVSKNTELTEIYSDGNRLADLDLSNNTRIMKCDLVSKISIPISSKSVKFDIKSIAPNIDVDRIENVENAELLGSYFYNYDLNTPIHYRYFTNQKDIYLSVELNLIKDSSLDPEDPTHGTEPPESTNETVAPTSEDKSSETEQIDRGGKRSAEAGGNSVKAADTGDANVYGRAALAAVAGGAVATTFVINRKKNKN